MPSQTSGELQLLPLLPHNTTLIINRYLIHTLSLSLSHRRKDKVLNAWIRQLCRMMKGADEKIDGVLQWFSHLERLENDRTAKRIYIGECAGSQSMDRPWKR